MSLLNDTIKSIDDGETLSLINELGAVTGVHHLPFRDSMLLHYFQQCIFPNGGAFKPVKISKDDLDRFDPHDEFVLRRKLGKLSNPLFQTFTQLESQHPHNPKGIDYYNGTSVYVFLNQMLAPTKKKMQFRHFR